MRRRRLASRRRREGAARASIAGTRRADPPPPRAAPAARRRARRAPPSGGRARRRARRRTAPRVARRSARARSASRDRQLPQVPAARWSTQYLQNALEVEHAANELAERYEEINLLYTISEILGRTVSLEEAAATILARGQRDGRRAPRIDPRARPDARHAAGRRALGGEAIADAADRARRRVQRQRARLPHAALDHRRRGRDALRAEERPTAAARCSPCRSCGPRQRRQRAARRRESLRPPLGAAVHRRRPEARRGDRDADRHRDPERAARARSRSSSSGSRRRCSSRTTCR